MFAPVNTRRHETNTVGANNPVSPWDGRDGVELAEVRQAEHQGVVSGLVAGRVWTGVIFVLFVVPTWQSSKYVGLTTHAA